MFKSGPLPLSERLGWRSAIHWNSQRCKWWKDARKEGGRGDVKKERRRKENKDKKFLNATIHSSIFYKTPTPCLNKTYNKENLSSFWMKTISSDMVTICYMNWTLTHSYLIWYKLSLAGYFHISVFKIFWVYKIVWFFPSLFNYLFKVF